MRFMIIRKADEETERGVMPSAELLQAMTQYNDELYKAGVLRGGEGLQPSVKGARVRFVGGNPVVVDGPFAESKELIAGFTLIEVGSREEAIEWVKRWPSIDGGGHVELELRQIFEMDDFGELMSAELKLKELRQREELAKKKG